MNKWVINIAFLLSAPNVMGQAINNHTQYIVHLPLVNPAAIVQKSSINGALFYKQQWVGFEGAPSSLFANFNMPLHKANSYLGGTLENDAVGVTNRFKFRAIYAYKAIFNDYSFFSLSLNPGIESVQSKLGEVRTDYENDPLFGGQTVKMTSINTGFGAYYYASRFYLGFTAAQLFYNTFESISAGNNQGKTTFDARQIPMMFHGGWRTDLNPLFTLEPSALVRYSGANPLQADINAMLLYRRKMGIAITYRTSNQVVVGFNIQASRDWRITYAYNTQLGAQLANNNSGSHEIGVVFGADNVRSTRVNLPGQIKKYKRINARRLKREPVFNPGGKRKKQPYS